MTDIGKQRRPGAGLVTRDGHEPDPRVSTWYEWVRVARSRYLHYVGLDPYADIAQRHHAAAVADLVPHLIAQLEYSWQQFEAWAKWWRDQHRADYGDEFVAKQAIDAMLNDLREHLVTGAPLHKECGPNMQPEDHEENRWTP